MNIILADERDGAASPIERTYEKPSVLVGRDAAESDIVFSRERFPMVSRKHAELRCQNGRWWVIDLNSSYGTFLNDEKLTAPQQLNYGDTVRIGEQGPLLRVIWFDTEGSPAADAVPAAPRSISVEPQPLSRPQPPPPAPSPLSQVAVPVPAAALPKQPLAPHSPPRLEFEPSTGRPPYDIVRPVVWIGREADCDIVMDLSAGMVSRRHAQLRIDGSSITLEDNNSFNGTLVNEQRITSATPLYHNDEIRLGVGGPVLRLNAPSLAGASVAVPAGQRAVEAGHSVDLRQAGGPKTMVFRLDRASQKRSPADAAQPQLLMTLSFGDKRELIVGRDGNVDISLDGLQISNRHAKLSRAGDGVVIEDLKSTNGIYINGQRVSKQPLEPEQPAQIGSFLIQTDAAGNISVFDTRAKTRLDAVNLTVEVKDRSGGGKIRLLDGVSISVQPNEFIGLLGPSGAGKSTLIDAMNGVRPADSGNVLINGQDLYRSLNSLKQYIGYVPQEDIIHRELSVYDTLYYVAKLRLSRDVSRKEIRQILDEVLDVTGLTERRNVAVAQLSGGQRKRVSIAVELITKPSVIFLDEPTSGLDPATEEKIMRLFRQIAESGRTVVMTTHAMENVRLFDKIVVLLAGKLVFYGSPDDALAHFGVATFKELYARLEASQEPSALDKAEARRSAENSAESFKQRYLGSPQYDALVRLPLQQIGDLPPAKRQKKRRLGIFGSISQWMTLSRRYLRVLFREKLTLFILFAQAPIIALMTFIVVGNDRPRDFIYFVVALVAVWFGTSVSAREIIREQPVYRRERMVNLGLLPYLGSKFFILGLIVFLQCFLLFVPLKIFDLAGLMPMPGELFGFPQFWTMVLTAGVGLALGLFVSAIVRTSQMATSLVPLILIPQILFSGIVGVPTGASKPLGLTMPATWSFDTMKRFSTLDTLEPEGSDPNGKTKGLGLYKFIESENDKTADEVRQQLDDYKRSAERRQQDAADDRPASQGTSAPSIMTVPKNLSSYVSFLYPYSWMNEVLNQAVLMIMLAFLAIFTLVVMRLKDN